MGASLPLYILAIIWGLVARLHAPGDPNGIFWEFFSFLASGGLLYRLYFRPAGRARFLLSHLASLLALIAAWGSTIYAGQLLLPPLVLATGLFLLVGQSRDMRFNPPWARPVGIALVVLSLPWSAYVVHRMLQFSKFLGIEAGQVEKIQIGDTVWTQPGDLEVLCGALHSTTPYSPNKERKNSPLSAAVVLKDGTTFPFRIARGNRTYADAAWIEFGVEVYQNRELGRLLEQARFKVSPPLP